MDKYKYPAYNTYNPKSTPESSFKREERKQNVVYSPELLVSKDVKEFLICCVSKAITKQRQKDRQTDGLNSQPTDQPTKEYKMFEY